MEECKLLSMPAEMRNRIYRLALLDPQEISVSAAGVPEPGFMRACKQIRQETFAIYYGENEFTVDMSRYDPTATVIWQRMYMLLYEKYRIQPVTQMHGDKTPNWQNLIRWLEQAHGGRIQTGMGVKKNAGVELHVVGAMFEAVRTLQDLPWKRVQEFLEEQRKILIILDKKWEDE